jgi:hypothetical protein
VEGWWVFRGDGEGLRRERVSEERGGDGDGDGDVYLICAGVIGVAFVGGAEVRREPVGRTLKY